VTVVLGAQWGDEGKHKLVELLDADVVCRCQGGNNRGYTVVLPLVRETQTGNANRLTVGGTSSKVVVGSTIFNFYLLPSGITNPKCTAVIGNGVVVHLPGLFEEAAHAESKGLQGWWRRLIISDRAHLVFDFHQEVDAIEDSEKVSAGVGLDTSRKGVGPTYVSKAR
jgi:adenylosuccinate synthase